MALSTPVLRIRNLPLIFTFLLVSWIEWFCVVWRFYFLDCTNIAHRFGIQGDMLCFCILMTVFEWFLGTYCGIDAST